MEVTEQELINLIETGDKVVLKAWQEGCSRCKTISPIMDKLQIEMPKMHFVEFDLRAKKSAAKIKGEFLKDAPERFDLPAILVFEDKQLKHRYFGGLSEEQLRLFIATGEEPVKAPKEVVFTLTGEQADKVHAALMEVPAKFSMNIITFLASIFGPQAEKQGVK